MYVSLPEVLRWKLKVIRVCEWVAGKRRKCRKQKANFVG